MWRKNITVTMQWTGLCLLLILASIYSRPPIPIDETRYLSVAWEMWHSHNFLVPHINGEPYSQKPPLLFWLIHLSWLLFGVGEWSARVVGPLFGFGSLCLTVRLAKRLWPEYHGVRWVAPFILLGTFVWSLYSTLTMFDTMLTFIVLFGLLCLQATQRSTGRYPWAGIALSIGLGILAKGPVVLLFILPPMLLAPLWREKGSMSWGRWYLLSLAALLGGIAVALCWAIPAALTGGQDYQQAILFRQTAGRMVQSFAHGRPFYWYGLLLPLLLFPWFFWPPAWRGWKKIVYDRGTQFCLCMVLPALVLLSLVSGKQIHYVLPTLPVIALLLAHTLATRPNRSRFDHLPLFLSFVALALALLIVPHLPLHDGDSDMFRFIPQWIGIVPLAAAFLVYRIRPASILGAVKAVTTSMLLLVILLQLALVNPLHAIYNQTMIGSKIYEAQQQDQPVAVFPDKLADQFQFAARLTTPLVPMPTLDALSAWTEKHKKGYCLLFTKSTGYSALQGAGTARQYSDGWLIFRPAEGFSTDYQQVAQKQVN